VRTSFVDIRKGDDVAVAAPLDARPELVAWSLGRDPSSHPEQDMHP